MKAAHSPKIGRVKLLVLLATFVVLGVNPGASQDIKMAGYPEIGAPAVVMLLAPGAEPRRPLRYKVPASFADHMTMAMQMSMGMEMPGMSLPRVQVPTMTVGAEWKVA